MQLRSLRDLLDEEFVAMKPNGRFAIKTRDDIEIIFVDQKAVVDHFEPTETNNQFFFACETEGTTSLHDCMLDEQLFEVYRVERVQL